MLSYPSRRSRKRLALHSGVIAGLLVIGASLAGAVPAAVAAPSTGLFTPPPAGATNLAPPSYAVASTSSDWVPTPDGLAYKHCSYPVPTGGTVDAAGNIVVNGVTQVVPPCPYTGVVPNPATQVSSAANSLASQSATPPIPDTNGWIAYSQWNSGTTWMRRLTSTSFVPPAPAANGATIFLFSSLENTDKKTPIIQPVLQYGGSQAGGGNYWAMAGWYVPNGNSYYSALTPVNAGDNLALTLNANECASNGTGCTWAIIIQDTTQGTQSRIDITSGTYYNYAQGGVLEVDSAPHCNYYPSNDSATWNNISIEGATDNPLTPNFVGEIPTPECSMTICRQCDPNAPGVAGINTP